MKIFILLLLSLSVQILFANGEGGTIGGSGKSWSDIIESKNLKPVFPKYEIEGRKFRVDQICLMGERVRTKKKYITTEGIKVMESIIYPTSLEMDYLVEDRVHMEKECSVKSAIWGCKEWEEKEIEIPKTMMITVKKKVERNKWKESFKKKYAIERCRSERKEKGGGW